MKNILDRLEDLPPERRELLIKLSKQQDKQVQHISRFLCSAAHVVSGAIAPNSAVCTIPRAST